MSGQKVTVPVLVERVENVVKQVGDLVTRIEKVEAKLTDVRLFQAKLIGIAVGVSFIVSIIVKVF